MVSGEGCPHCGQMIQSHLLAHKISLTFVADKLGVRPSTVKRYFESVSLQMGIVWKISRALNYNFVAAIAETLHIAHPTQAADQLKDELAKKDEIIQKLEMKVEVYKELKG
jgi:transcriptional regulator with XRE-family HTH domain